MYCHQWYAWVYTIVGIGGLLTKTVGGYWVVSLLSLLVYPLIQYWRALAVLMLVRHFSMSRCSLANILSVPVFLIHALMFRHQAPGLVVDMAAAVIAFILSFLEQIFLGILIVRNQDWSLCSIASLFHLLVFTGSTACLILSLII